MTVGENVAFSLIEHAKATDEELEGPCARTWFRRPRSGPARPDAGPAIGRMQRRVAIARALAARNPQILLYDEPTTGLDPQSAERITD